MYIYTREELEALKGFEIKDILRERNIDFLNENKKLDNIELLLNCQSHHSFDEVVNNQEMSSNNLDTTEQKDTLKDDTLKIFEIDRQTATNLYNDLIKNNKIFSVDEEELDIATIEIYEKSPISYTDDFFVETDLELYTGLVIISNSQNEVFANGHLVKVNNGYNIVVSAKDMDFSTVGQNARYNIVLFKDSEKANFVNNETYKFEFNGYKGSCRLNFRKMEVIQKALCIDLGTSNTAIGSYGILDNQNNEIELVEFVDYTSKDYSKTNVYPTMVYVKDCSKDKIEYLFGYEAKKKIIEKDYNTKASTFLEIKRWINELDVIEEISDEEENIKNVSRKEIFKAYIDHIIDLSIEYFKVKFNKLHFSAPIKLKDKFNSELKALLQGEYNVLPSKSTLDEGISIIYNHISQVMKDYDCIPKHTKTNVMIIDCGGGTTDLASCSYSFEKSEAGYDLEINTKFENGNSNFGGNNLTYRIFQFLKLRFASCIDSSINSDIKELIPFNENEILENIDHNNLNIYQEFENAYQNIEKVIPTKFNDTSLYKGETKQKNIKRNFHYLWQLAEKIKIEFYKRTDLLSVNFLEDNGESKNIRFEEEGTFYFYSINSENNKLEKNSNVPSISINIKEITTLLYADIYSLLNNLIGSIDVKYYLNFKLSGQSCKITLFNQLLKEFIPGKRLRTTSSTNNSEKLKLECIRGSIAYIKDKECGKVTPKIYSENPEIIYNVFIERGEKIQVLNGKGLLFEPAFFKKTASTINFEVENNNNIIENKFEYNLQFQGYTISLESLRNELLNTTIIKEDYVNNFLSNISNKLEIDSISVFTIPAKDNYGFYIYQLAKVKDENGYSYAMPKNPTYKNFEGNVSTETFFNGYR